MALNVTPFVGTDNFNMETFNNMISQINSGVNGEISDVLAQLGTKAKIQTGSYVGTGTYGSANKNSLTFDFDPKIVFIKLDANVNSSSYTILGVFVPGNNYAIGISYDRGNGLYLYVTYSNKTMSWYNSVSAEAQENASGKQYYYVAIG